MKFLLDMPVSAQLLDVLRSHGHEGVHAHAIGQDRATDHQPIDLARREARVIITADLDFPRLLALTSADGPGLILFRGGNYSDAEMCDLLQRVLTAVSPDVLPVAICVVDKNRIRITRLPLDR
jgi:predicted nuclease of predicted toxin-antitoxin system